MRETSAEKILRLERELRTEKQVSAAMNSEWVVPPSSIQGPTLSYSVELGGEKFTQAQWEAVQVYVEGRISAAVEGLE